jgi:hypothetical protein
MLFLGEEGGLLCGIFYIAINYYVLNTLSKEF